MTAHATLASGARRDVRTPSQSHLDALDAVAAEDVAPRFAQLHLTSSGHVDVAVAGRVVGRFDLLDAVQFTDILEDLAARGIPAIVEFGLDGSTSGYGDVVRAWVHADPAATRHAIAVPDTTLSDEALSYAVQLRHASPAGRWLKRTTVLACVAGLVVATPHLPDAVEALIRYLATGSFDG